jgi:hypothetical protein
MHLYPIKDAEGDLQVETRLNRDSGDVILIISCNNPDATRLICNRFMSLPPEMNNIINLLSAPARFEVVISPDDDSRFNAVRDHILPSILSDQNRDTVVGEIQVSLSEIAAEILARKEMLIMTLVDNRILPRNPTEEQIEAAFNSLAVLLQVAAASTMAILRNPRLVLRDVSAESFNDDLAKTVQKMPEREDKSYFEQECRLDEVIKKHLAEKNHKSINDINESDIAEFKDSLEIPEKFFDPVSQNIMQNPVKVEFGGHEFIYDRTTFDKLKAMANPITHNGIPIPTDGVTITEDVELKAQIKEFVDNICRQYSPEQTASGAGAGAGAPRLANN